MKVNCWEYMKCGREKGGSKTADLGICPATQEKSLNGEHGGANAGRACWVLAGTMCRGQLQGSFAQKYEDCLSCNFYRKVKIEEGSGFQLSVILLNKLKKKLQTKS